MVVMQQQLLSYLRSSYNNSHRSSDNENTNTQYMFVIYSSSKYTCTAIGTCCIYKLRVNVGGSCGVWFRVRGFWVLCLWFFCSLVIHQFVSGTGAHMEAVEAVEVISSLTAWWK